EVELKNVPPSLAEALGFEKEKETQALHARPVAAQRGGWSATDFHGQGVDSNDKKEDLLLYFQKVNRGVAEYLRGQKGPLILASVDYAMPIYREANTYTNLLPDGIAGHPDRLGAHDLFA